MPPRLSLDGLNPPQRKAVQTLRGPLLVLAGAGTGKTRVVTYRIAELIRTGTPPSRILAVTFTNKAAAEMQERVASLLGRVKEKPVVSTFHSYCVKILRRHIRLLGYPERFAIYDRGDQESLARGVLREIKVPGTLLKPSELIGQIGRWKCASIRPPQAATLAQTDKEHLAAMAYRRYQKALKNAGAVDFDDLLICTEDLFAKFSDARREEAARFDHLLIDEYQDTNASQYRIVTALARDHGNLCVVGDDDQSIYGFRGAEVEHILRFTRDWPRAAVVRLEDNYRSTTAIITIANRLIAYNKTRHAKVLRAARHGGERPKILQFKDETEEAEAVVADILRRIGHDGVEARDFCILFRTNEQPRAFESELRKRKVPYVLIGGMSFFDRKEVRDILAYLKTLVMPHDEVSLLRIINTPPRGIGGKTVETLLARAVSEGKPLWDLLASPAGKQGLPAAAAEAVERFVGLIEDFRRRVERQTPVEVANALIAKIDYEGELRRIYTEEAERDARWAVVGEVVNALGVYQQKNKKKATLAGFLDDVALGGREFDDEKDKQLRRNAVALMTLHSAKGLEFPQVYMVGMEEGILPHHRSIKADGDAIEEERRLCYVGVTRAQERLTLSMALSRMKWGRPRDTDASRFLWEIIGRADNPHAGPPPQKRTPAAKRKTK
ncbi:MAG: UvrD-helicase domain-containing protein [Pirellulaceae bacterium]